jgi:hypothetical protein
MPDVSSLNGNMYHWMKNIKLCFTVILSVYATPFNTRFLTGWRLNLVAVC